MTTTTTVVGKVKAPDGTVVEGAEILARLNGFDYDEEFGYITSRRISTTTDANGEFSFELWPNTRGTEGTIYRIVINSPVNGVSTNFTATIPEQAQVELNDAADFSPVPPLSDAEQLVNDAKAFKDKAKAFATEAEDVEVEPGLFSALHYSAKAEDSATAASTSESNAASSESAASTSASNAATSESNAASSASAAATSETNAQTAETGAVSAKDDAVAAKNATESIFDTFDDRFLGSFSSAPTTDNDGNPIVAGAVYYDTTQQEVYFYNGATWDAPAAQAETSATNALASENAAAISESNAATSESNAASSETAAANSASAAATSESNAAISETNAASSASAAATSESNAATSESNAAASASAAATSESNAASSATSAATSESNAATSETNAANSASAAATSETNAADSASAAATSESNAATSAQNAANSFDSFDDRYLGSKTSEPATDNDGDPLLEGALYYDSTSGALRFYDGAAWNTIATRSDAEIRALFSGSGDIVYNSSTGDFSVTTYKSSDFDTDFGNKDTDDLTEGTGNLYYTDTRARGAVSASGDLSYNAATGEFSFTETPNYTDSDVDAHLSGGTGVTYSTGTISIGQDVGTGASVSFSDVSAQNMSSDTISAGIITSGADLSWDSSGDIYTRQSNLNGSVTAVHEGMKRCLLLDDGTVNYYLDPNDSTLKEDGTAADLSGADGMVMVEVPKFYFRFEFEGNKRIWKVSDLPIAGYQLHPAFFKNGEIVDYRYMGAYDACVYDDSASTYISGLNLDENIGNVDLANDKLASVSGIYPMVGLERDEFRALAANRGAGWRQQDFWLTSAVQLLYVVEYGDFNSQANLGDGNVNGSFVGSSSNQNDSPLTIAGASNGFGSASTDGSQPSAGAKPGTAYMSYRGIENFYGNCWDFVDGFNIIDLVPYVNNDDTTFADDTTTNYEQIGDAMPSSNGFVTDIQNIGGAFIPASVGGSSSTFLTDDFFQNTGNRVALFGGNADLGSQGGAFYWIVGVASSADSRDIGGRLSF